MKHFNLLIFITLLSVLSGCSDCNDKLLKLYSEYLDIQQLNKSDNSIHVSAIQENISRSLKSCDDEQNYIFINHPLLTNTSYVTFLELAMISNDKMIFQKYLNQSQQIPSKIESVYFNSLFLASMLNNQDFIKSLLEKGWDINVINNQGYSPILSTNSLEIVKLFIAKGANLNTKSKNGITFSCLLSIHENKEIAQFAKERLLNECNFQGAS